MEIHFAFSEKQKTREMENAEEFAYNIQEDDLLEYIYNYEEYEVEVENILNHQHMGKEFRLDYEKTLLRIRYILLFLRKRFNYEDFLEDEVMDDLSTMVMQNKIN
jgi:hypothetical protein